MKRRENKGEQNEKQEKNEPEEKGKELRWREEKRRKRKWWGAGRDGRVGVTEIIHLLEGVL